MYKYTETYRRRFRRVQRLSRHLVISVSYLYDSAQFGPYDVRIHYMLKINREFNPFHASFDVI